MVESALNCLDNVAVEQAKGVSISPEIVEEESSKVQWVGYTAPVAGDFAAVSRKSGLLAGSEMCAALYPASRMMMWNDYINIITSYPHTDSIWFVDGIQAANGSENSNTKSDTLIFKSGESVYHNYSASYGANFSGSKLPITTSCAGWTSKHLHSSLGGVFLNTLGKLSISRCDAVKRLACVK